MLSPPPYSIPQDFCAPFGAYPNPLQLADHDRLQFAPVVIFPTKQEGDRLVPNYRILDHTTPWKDKPSQLVTPEQHQAARDCIAAHKNPPPVGDFHGRDFDWFGVGRYDENRLGMYDSELFQVQEASDQRTVHIGIDLDGPVGTPVHAFTQGTVHSVGYNDPLGDYGNVIVVEHELPSEERKVFALYGHLNGFCVEHFQTGSRVEKGQVLGYMGAYWENGGWTIPHVHFQLSLQPPTVPHDMPGAVAVKDRRAALWNYPDPRYVLGALY